MPEAIGNMQALTTFISIAILLAVTVGMLHLDAQVHQLLVRYWLVVALAYLQEFAIPKTSSGRGVPPAGHAMACKDLTDRLAVHPLMTGCSAWALRLHRGKLFFAPSR